MAAGKLRSSLSSASLSSLSVPSRTMSTRASSSVAVCPALFALWIRLSVSSPAMSSPAISALLSQPQMRWNMSHCVKTWRHSQNRKYTQHIALSSEEDHATRPRGTCRENFMKLEHVFFETCERTDRHADRNTSQPSWERSKWHALAYNK